MQIKKELILFCLLLVICGSLLISADFSADKVCPVQNKKTPECCLQPFLPAEESPWNFITQGILHLSV